MRVSQRQHDVIFGGGGLQFEIECPAEALAQRQSPGAIHAAAERSSVRAGASPSQNGIEGGWPRASSTRTVPRSTRKMRYDVLPNWNTSPCRLSTAKSSLTVPTRWPSGSSITL